VAEARTFRNGKERDACVVVAVWARGGVEPVVRLAVRSRALGTQMRVCAPPDCVATEKCDALVVTGVASAGVWR